MPDLLNDALALHRAGQWEGAARLYQSILAGQPDDPDALHLLGVLHYQQGQHARAVELIGRAVALCPGAAVIHANLAEVFRALGQFERAADSCRTALRLQPESPGALNNLGLALRGLGRYAEAIEQFRRALALKPDFAEVHNNLGDTLRRQGQLGEATAALEQALRLRPEYAEAHNNLALLRLRQGRMEEALAGFTEAVRLEPGYAEAHCNRGMAWLLLGNLTRGWPEYEWRRRTKGFKQRPFAQPDWDGAPLDGRTVLLYAEQGLGDAIQFVRYAPLVQKQGGEVLVEAPPRLLPLLKSCPGIDGLVPGGGPLPSFDVQAPLLSLPGLLGTTLGTIPASIPYLWPDPDPVRRWRKQLKPLRGLRVGIAWQGSPTYGEDYLRSIPLGYYAPLARLPGVRLISLQKGPGTEQLAALVGDWGIHDLGPGLDEERGAFMDTAAVMACLDLVITSDTAIAHLAGALGVPVWVALPDACDWRWLLERPDSPWYPTMRLFRQRRGGSWDEVFARIAAMLTSKPASGGC
jgi:tetratricopeptide (TPR) repeat protein